jgi:hypothetical protein
MFVQDADGERLEDSLSHGRRDCFASCRSVVNGWDQGFANFWAIHRDNPPR